MVQLANGFAEYNDDVHLVVINPTGPYKNEVSPKVNISVLNKQKATQAIWPMRKWLKTNRPDILLTTQGHVSMAGYLSLLGNRVPTKLVCREASTPSKCFSFVKSRKARLALRLNKWIYHRASGVVGTSKAVRNDLISFYGLPENQVVALYAPNISDDIHAKSKHAIDDPRFKQDKPVILTMGRVSPEKDYETLIRAFGVAQKNHDCYLYHLGLTDQRPDYFERLQSLIRELHLEDRCYFLGFKPNPYPYLAATHVYVLSSLYEGLPGALVHAMALGTNIVSTDCESGPREILKDGKYGELVQVGDPSSMAQSILKQLAAPRNAQGDPEACLEFTRPHAIQKWLNYFSSLVEE